LTNYQPNENEKKIIRAILKRLHTKTGLLFHYSFINKLRAAFIFSFLKAYLQNQHSNTFFQRQIIIFDNDLYNEDSDLHLIVNFDFLTGSGKSFYPYNGYLLFCNRNLFLNANLRAEINQLLSVPSERHESTLPSKIMKVMMSPSLSDKPIREAPISIKKTFEQAFEASKQILELNLAMSLHDEVIKPIALARHEANLKLPIYSKLFKNNPLKPEDRTDLNIAPYNSFYKEIISINKIEDLFAPEKNVRLTNLDGDKYKKFYNDLQKKRKMTLALYERYLKKIAALIIQRYFAESMKGRDILFLDSSLPALLVKEVITHYLLIRSLPTYDSAKGQIKKQAIMFDLRINEMGFSEMELPSQNTLNKQGLTSHQIGSLLVLTDKAILFDRNTNDYFALAARVAV
jgi:hypothetical protein